MVQYSNFHQSAAYKNLDIKMYRTVILFVVLWMKNEVHGTEEKREDCKST